MAAGIVLLIFALIVAAARLIVEVGIALAKSHAPSGKRGTWWD